MGYLSRISIRCKTASKVVAISNYHLKSGTFILVLIFLLISLSGPAQAFKVLFAGEPENWWHLGEPIHEGITQEALSFIKLNPVLEDIIEGQHQADIDHQIDSEFHFDDCAFQASTTNIKNLYSEVLADLNPASTNLEEAAKNFGMILHLAQDFYAHSNWVENGKTELVDNGLGEWNVLDPYEVVKGVMIVEGETFPEDDLADPIGKVFDARDPNGAVYPGLISASAYLNDNCPDKVAIGHADSVTPEIGLSAGDSSIPGILTNNFIDPGEEGFDTGLNKDDPSRPRYHEARVLATLQTRHEWCRLTSLVKQKYGATRVDSVFSEWVENRNIATCPEDPNRLFECRRLDDQLICGAIESSNRDGKKKDIFSTNEDVLAKIQLISTDPSSEWLPVYIVQSGFLTEGVNFASLYPPASHVPLAQDELYDSLDILIGSGLNSLDILIGSGLNTGPQSYEIVIDIDNNGWFDSSIDIVDHDGFEIENIPQQIDFDVDSEGNVHVVGLIPSVDTGTTPPHPYTRLMYAKIPHAKIPHDADFKTDLENSELFDWSRAIEVSFSSKEEIPRSRVTISNPKIAVDRNGEPYIIFERVTSGHRWLQWTKLTKEGKTDTQFFYPIKLQQFHIQTATEPVNSLFKEVFLAGSDTSGNPADDVLDITKFRDGLPDPPDFTLPRGESVPTMPIIFYSSRSFIDFNLTEPDIAIDPHDNRPVITAVVKARAPSALFMDSIYPILAINPDPLVNFFFLSPLSLFSLDITSEILGELGPTLRRLPPSPYFGESIQVAKLIGADLGTFATGWPGDYAVSDPFLLGQDSASFVQTMQEISGLIRYMAVPSEQSDHWKWRRLDSASLRLDFDMFSNPRIFIDDAGDVHVAYHKGAIMRVRTPNCSPLDAGSQVWDPAFHSAVAVQKGAATEAKLGCIDGTFSEVEYKKVAVHPADDLPSPFNIIEIPVSGERPSKVSHSELNAPNSIDVTADANGNPHIVWKSEDKIMYACRGSPPSICPYVDFFDQPAASLSSDSLPHHLGMPKIVVNGENVPIIMWNDKTVGGDEQLLSTKVQYDPSSIFRAVKFTEALQLVKALRIINPLFDIKQPLGDPLYVLWLDTHEDMGSRMLLKRTLNPSSDPTILLVLDGFSSSALFDNLASMDNLNELMADNPTLRGSATTSVPQTIPSQASLLTALQPDQHGMLADKFTRSDGENRSYLPDNSHDPNEDLTVPTLYDYIDLFGRSKTVVGNVFTKGVGQQPEDNIVPPRPILIDWNSGTNDIETAIGNYFDSLNLTDRNSTNNPAELITVYILKNNHTQTLDNAVNATEVDDIIGHLLKKLKEKSLLENSLFVIISDHGLSGDNQSDSVVPVIITGPRFRIFSAQEESYQIPEKLDITDIGTTTSFFVGGQKVVDAMAGVDGKNLFDPQLKFTAESPVDLHLTDREGKHVGPVAGNIQNQIPLSYYIYDPQSEQRRIILLQAPGKYRAEFEASGSGTVKLAFEQSNGGESVSVRYPTFNVTKGSRGIIDMINNDFNLKFDFEGNGDFERTIEPSSFAKTKQNAANASASSEVIRISGGKSAEIEAVESTGSRISLRASNDIHDKNIRVEKRSFNTPPDGLFDLGFEVDINFDSGILENSGAQLSLVIPQFIRADKRIVENSLSIYLLENGTFAKLNSSFDASTNLLRAAVSKSGRYAALASDLLPGISNVTVSPARTRTPSANLIITATVKDDQNVSNVTVSFLGSVLEMQFTPPSLYTASLAGPSVRGKYPVVIKAADNNGNVGEKTGRFFELDDVAPIITINFPQDGSFLFRNTFDLAYFVNERSDQSFILDGTEMPTNETSAFKTTRIRIANLTPGIHTLSVKAADDLGNSNTKTVSFTVDNHSIHLSNFVSTLAAKPDEIVSFFATAENTLSFFESNVTFELLADNVPTASKIVNFTGGEVKNISFVWNATPGRHNITIRAVPIIGERVVEDNEAGDKILVTNKIPVLLVEDDGAATTNALRNSITSANVFGLPGFDHVPWDVEARGSPSLSVLQQLKAVIWHTANESKNTLTAQDRINLAAFLDDGGNLFISGNRIGRDTGFTDFYKNTLKSEFVGESTTKIVEGKLFTIGQGFLLLLSENGEIIKGLPGTETAFSYSGGGTAGITYVDDKSHIVYLPFAFETIPDPAEQNNLMKKILEFFDIDVIPPVISDISPVSGSKFPINTSNMTLTLKTNEMAECRQGPSATFFDLMAPFATTNGLTHSTTITDLIKGVNTTVKIACRDGDGNIGEAQTSVFVYNRTFRPPVIQPIADKNISENETFVLKINVTDPEDDAISLSLKDFEVLGITKIASRFTPSNNTFTLTTNFDDAGEYSLRISATDQFNSSSAEFRLIIENVNRPPILEPISPQFLVEDSYYLSFINASDADRDEITFFDDTELFDIHPFLGIISFVPKNEDVGLHTVNISISDRALTGSQIVQFFIAASQNVNFSINNTNDPPEIQFVSPSVAFVGHPFTLQIDATDEDGDKLFYFDDSTFFDINASTGLINFTPTETQLGSHVSIITVSDGIALTHRQINILIKRPPIVKLEPIANITVTEGDLVKIAPNVTFRLNGQGRI